MNVEKAGIKNVMSAFYIGIKEYLAMKKRSGFRLAVILLILLAIGMSGACLLQKQHKTDVSERVRITAMLPENCKEMNPLLRNISPAL